MLKKKLWDSVREMTNLDYKQKPMSVDNEIVMANELNDFPSVV